MKRLEQLPSSADRALAGLKADEALKQRILSNRGHLSNAACADALLQLVDSGVHHVILGHLSGENNLPELALRTSEDRAEQAGLRLGRDLSIDLAWRDRVGGVYTLKEGS